MESKSMADRKDQAEHIRVAYERAKIALIHSDLDEASKLNNCACELMSPGKPNHSSVMATRYLQGRINLLRGDDEAALVSLRDALTICEVNEAQRGNQGESARVKWRMSQILERQGMAAEAKETLDAAEETKKTLAATGDYAKGLTEDDSWDTFMGLLYR